MTGATSQFACAEPRCIAVVANKGDECPIHRDLCACGHPRRQHPVVLMTEEFGAIGQCYEFHKWDGEFVSHQQWINKATSWLSNHDNGWKAQCFDAKGRACLVGADFARAHDEGAYPVRYRFRAESG